MPFRPKLTPAVGAMTTGVSGCSGAPGSTTMTVPLRTAKTYWPATSTLLWWVSEFAPLSSSWPFCSEPGSW